MKLAQRMGIVEASASLPTLSGDVAQVADLPPAVAGAFGINIDTERVTRKEALTIPSVRRGLQVIAGTLSQFPLQCSRVALGEDGRTMATLPRRELVRRSLLEQPDPALTRSKWVMRVASDLVLHEHAWCRVPANGRDSYGFPRWLEWLDQRHLRIDAQAQTVEYKGERVPLRDLVRFDTPLDHGLLVDGAVVLRTALKLEATVRRYADEPAPLGVLRDDSGATSTGRDKLTDEHVQALLDKWEAGARRRVTRWLGRIKYERIQFDAAQLQLTQARERSDVAVAQLLNLESTQVNAPGETGMTYSNKEANAAERVVSVQPYMAAITERLSLPDITPAGQLVTFDTTRYVRGTTAEVVTTAGAAVRDGLVTRDEARDRWLDLPPLDLADDEPTTEETDDAAA